MPDRDRQNPPTEPFVEVCPNTLLADRYWIERELSRGGWAVVYLAQDRGLFNKSVAVKVLQTEQVSQDRLNDRWIKRQFFQEMEALGRIDHPNVVKVLNYGETPGGKLYIAMQYINGVTLDEVIGKDGMDFKHVAYIVRQVGRALTAAHEQGILHCDLKPKNIMLQDYGEANEMVKLIDFGVARVSDSQVATSMVSRDYSGKGTWQYSSPEQLASGEIGEWTDLYGFGVIVYEMITGRRPFVTNTQTNLAWAQRAGIKVTAKDLRMELPDDANAALLKALEYDPIKRYHSYVFMHDFGEDLAHALEGDRYRTRHIGQTGKAGAQTMPPGANEGAAEPPPSALFDAHVLCLGLIEEAAASLEKQIEDRKRLDEIVRRTPTFQREIDRVRSRHSHESLALLFNRRASDAVLCGLETASELVKHPSLSVRMGAHTGPIFYVKAEGGQADPIGGGINIAEQVMSCGDAGHILLSESIAKQLQQLDEWRDALRDMGEHEAKPGTAVYFFNLCRDGLGNPQIPRRFNEKAGAKTNGDGLPEILTLGLSVSMRESHNEKGAKREKLEYKPDRIGNMRPLPVGKAVNSQMLEDKLADLRQEVEKLIRRAREGGNHEGIPLEETAYALAQYVLPNGGMESLVGQVAHPQFDIEGDLAAKIPWELLEERFYGCSDGHRFNSPLTYCGYCKKPLQLKSSRLALDYHLTHVARGSGYPVAPVPALPGGQGKRFLFIEDPTGEFCASDDDDETGELPAASPGLDPRRFCSSHLKALRTWAKRAGYQVQRLPGVIAKRGAVLSALRDPDVAAIYFFGHCRIPDKESQSYLVLADNRLLPASEIEQAAPQARFIFLNACEAASTHSGWELDDGPLSLAHAFAQGSLDKVVIAPIWPVVSVQAAETARRFFDLAWQGMSLGESLKQSRAESHRLYEQGQAHLAWFSYRYFGDPNEKLAHPAVVPPPINETEEVKKVHRVFDAKGRFVTKVFSFAIDRVLLRAAKRRNLQARELVTASDFLAGLVRKGDLTQFVLEESRIDPDKFYKAIYARKEEEAPGNAAVTDTMNLDLGKISREQINALLARWVVRDRKQFAEDLVNALERADEIAQQRAAEAGAKDGLIAEQDVLESLIACGNWAGMGTPGLPADADVERLLARRAEFGIDENGWVSLEGLDPGARKVVTTAHRLARQRRLFPIPTRLMLAALLKEKDGFAARVCRSAGVDPKLLAAFMIVMAEGPDKVANRASDSFGLSRKACRRIVLPVIEEAKRLAGSNPVTDKELFQAFCHCAAPQFKKWLSQPFSDREMEIVETDLDELKTMDPDRDNLMQGLMRGLTLRARRVIAASHQLSQQYGMFPISNRLTLAAFLTTPRAFAAEVCRRHRIPDEELAKRLAAAARGRASRKFAMTGEACERVVAPMIEHARSAGEEFITEASLFKSFCAVTDPKFKQAMKEARVDLDALAAEPVTPPKNDPGDDDPPSGDEDAPTRDLDNAVPPTAKIETPEGVKG